MLIRFLSSILLILTMYGCQSTPTSITPRADLAELDAYALLRQAQTATGSRGAALRIQAALVFEFNAQPGEVVGVLEAMDPASMRTELADERARLLARAWLSLRDYPKAEEALSGLVDWQGKDQLLLAELCDARGDHRCSADGMIQAAADLGADADGLPADLNDRIWYALSRAATAPSMFTQRDHHAWWLLQEKIRTAGSITGQIEAWRAWQASYPNHPARLNPPTALRKLEDYRSPRVGLLLPLSGPFASAGIAVRDGLIAAYLSEHAADKPQIRIYDTGQTPIETLFEQALVDGADVLVGPLLKDDVEKFAAFTSYAAVPRLVLNYLSEPEPDLEQAAPADHNPPFQLGIAIEDEVTSLADHVLLQGLQRLLVVHSQARWSQRAYAAYTERWPYPVTSAGFTDIKGLTAAVGEAMQVAASEERKTEIANILGQQLEFMPRARGDLDGVIALTTQVEAQALVPALRFHFADNLPVFATSQAARGRELAGLAGFRLTEMPVFAAPNAAQRGLDEAFGLSQSPFGELYALGFDAYRVATWLPVLDLGSRIALPAASGYLWLDRGGKFRRELTLSRITGNGEMVAAD